MEDKDNTDRKQTESSMAIIREGTQDHKLVLKGNALIEARYGLSVTAQKLFLGLIARVNPTSSKLPSFKLTRKELLSMDIGVGKQTAYRNFTDACLELLGLRVSMVEKNLKTGEVEDTDINIFSKNTRTWKDQERKELKEVEFRFTRDVEPYLRDFSGDIHYTKYLYRHIKFLPTSHAIRIYELLRRWRNIKETKPVITKVVQLSDLREMLGLEPDKYRNFSNFKTRILNPAQKQIEEHTDIRFEFDGEKGNRGKRVEIIRFEIYDNTLIEAEPVDATGEASEILFRDDIEVDSGISEKLYRLFPELEKDQRKLYSLFESFSLTVLRESIGDFTFAVASGELKIKSKLSYFRGICKNKQKEYAAAKAVDTPGSYDPFDRGWADVFANTDDKT